MTERNTIEEKLDRLEESSADMGRCWSLSREAWTAFSLRLSHTGYGEMTA